MYKKDEALGRKIAQELKAQGIESPVHDGHYLGDLSIAGHFAKIMCHLNMNVEDPNISDTPRRVEKMFRDELFYGLDYKNFPKCTTTPNTKPVMDSVSTSRINVETGERVYAQVPTAMKQKKVYDEMVCEKGITVHSMCEHHFVPFIGRATVAYIPHEALIGLSKLNRVVDFFCRRPQVQERLTAQISTALQTILGTEDVAVVIDAEHLCVKLRGIQHQGASTVTSMLCGKFKSVDALRNEFLQLSKVR